MLFCTRACVCVHTCFGSFSLSKLLSSSSACDIVDGRDLTTCAQSPNCGDKGNTEFANCLHKGHKYSPLKPKNMIKYMTLFSFAMHSYFSGIKLCCRCCSLNECKYEFKQSRCKWWPQVCTCTPPSQPRLIDNNQDCWFNNKTKLLHQNF